MAAYLRVYGFGHLQADCRGPGSALEIYVRFQYGTTLPLFPRASIGKSKQRLSPIRIRKRGQQHTVTPSGECRHFDLELWLFGPKTNLWPGCLTIITYTKFGDPKFIIFDLSCKKRHMKLLSYKVADPKAVVQIRRQSIPPSHGYNYLIQ